MLKGLKDTNEGTAVLLFVRQFYGRGSANLWEDEEGGWAFTTSCAEKAEWRRSSHAGAFLFGPAQGHVAVKQEVELGESLFVFLDDIVGSARWGLPHAPQEELRVDVRTRVHQSKTHLLNRGGLFPVG